MPSSKTVGCSFYYFILNANIIDDQKRVQIFGRLRVSRHKAGTNGKFACFSDSTRETVRFNQRFYIGFKTREQAERAIERRAEFRVYKRLSAPLDIPQPTSDKNYEATAPLMLVYRTCGGKFVYALFAYMFFSAF